MVELNEVVEAIKLENIRVNGNTTIGSLNRRTDVMFSISGDGFTGVHNFYLTTEKAEQLVEDLKKVIDNNKDVDPHELKQRRDKAYSYW